VLIRWANQIQPETLHQVLERVVDLVSIHKPGRGLKKKMYHVQMGVAKQPRERIHLGREWYTKAEKCRLLSRASALVATAAAVAAEGQT
jgi:hypothetical protein